MASQREYEGGDELKLRCLIRDSGVVLWTSHHVLRKETIGKGSFGTVLKAIRKSDGSLLALKEMFEPNSSKIFTKEMKFLSGLEHPNIIHMEAVILEPTTLVLEYMSFDLQQLDLPEIQEPLQGHNLRDLLRILVKRDLVIVAGIRMRVMLKVAVDVASGLSYLHCKDTCHRDLKPANILVRNDGKALLCKLTDFGEARSPQIQTQVTSRDATERVLRGTLAYAAPEQLLNKVKAATLGDLKRTDVWAYAMILYCLLNPDLQCPWELDSTDVITLISAMSTKSRPSHSPKYRALQSETGCLDIYELCSSVDPKARPGMDTVVALLIRHIFTSRSPEGSHIGADDTLTSPSRQSQRHDYHKAEELDATLRADEKVARGQDFDNIREYYAKLRLRYRMDEKGSGPGALQSAQGLCVSRGRILVADNKSSRVVAFHQPAMDRKYEYLCHVDMEDGIFCAENPKSGLVYVACQLSNLIMELKWSADGDRLLEERTLVAGATLLLPRTMTFDPTGEYMFVACQNGVHKVALDRDELGATLWAPPDVNGSPERLASVSSTVLVSYTEDRKLVRYEREDALGEVIEVDDLSNPRALYSDGENFLVCDREAPGILVLSVRGDRIARVDTGEEVPFDLAVSGESVVFVGGGTNSVFVMTS